MLLGYARTSTADQDAEMQVRELRRVGVERIFTECASGGRWNRPELHRMLDQLRPGDVIVTWKLDRLTRSLHDLLRLLERIEQVGGGFRSLTESLDTTTPAGRMMTQLIGVFAEFERQQIRERTRAGLVAAAAEGRRGGARPKLKPAQREAVIDMVESGQKTAAQAARLFQVSDATISRLLARSRAVRDPVEL